MAKRKSKPTQRQLQKKAEVFIKKTLRGFILKFPYDFRYCIIWEKANANPRGGPVAIRYIPENREAQLCVFKDFLEICRTSKKRARVALAHEVSHILVWKLANAGTKREFTGEEFNGVLEETVTDVATVLLK